MKLKSMRRSLVEMYQTDVAFSDNLHDEALRVDQLHAKYLKLYDEARAIEREVRHEKKRIRRLLFDWYRGFLNTKVEALHELDRGPCEFAPPAKDLEFYVDSDPKGIEISSIHAEACDYADDLDRILKKIESRGHAIHNALEYLKHRAAIT